jgi:hypothetical protein
MTKRTKSIYKKRIWSDNDKDYLRDNYNNMPMPGLMKHLSRTDFAIHKMAGLLKITGNRQHIHNYKNGTSYKSTGKKPGIAAPKRKIKPVVVSVAKVSRKAKPPMKHRWCDQKLDMKPFNPTGKILIRVDHRTSIYVPASASQKEIDIIINRYKKVS